jgi:hypothetical protein
MQPVDENGIYVVTEEEAAEYGLEGTENFKKELIPHDVDAGSTNAGLTNQDADIIVTPDMVKDKVQQGFGKAMVVGIHQVSEWDSGEGSVPRYPSCALRTYTIMVVH